ncbi:MAG: hypothetical protein MJA32_13445 [Proteobacteria bacterium]|nr:hypothetical protein [Pseudomonadota bacterium]
MGKIHRALIQQKRRSQQPETGRREADARKDTDDTSRLRALSDPLVVGDARTIGVDRDVQHDNKILAQNGAVRHAAEGAYRMLRTRVMRSMRSNDWKVLGVSSGSQNEGKTYTAINLAISIAAEVDQEVVLIDLDLRRPTVYRCLGVDPEDVTDLKDYFDDDDRDLQELFVCPEIERLACILSTDPLDRPSDVLAAAAGRTLFDELRERLGPDVVVIVDLPPLLAADDALAVAPMLDAFLLVVAEGQAERQDLEEVRMLLSEFNHIGTVLNKSIEKDSRRANYY